MFGYRVTGSKRLYTFDIHTMYIQFTIAKFSLCIYSLYMYIFMLVHSVLIIGISYNISKYAYGLKRSKYRNHITWYRRSILMDAHIRTL